MITAVWSAAFWGLFGLFWAGVVGAVAAIVWRASRFFYLREQRRKRWQTRRARVLLLRAVDDLDYQARVLRRVARQDELAEIRAEILGSENETPHLVSV